MRKFAVLWLTLVLAPAATQPATPAPPIQAKGPFTIEDMVKAATPR
jgi:hypothetical protein